MFTFALYVLPMLGPVLLLMWLSKNFKTDAFHLFLSLAIFSGLILGRFLDGSGTESYFLHVTMPLSLLLIALLLKNINTLTTHVISFQVFAASSMSGLVLGYLQNMGSGLIKSHGIYSVVWRSAPYLIVYTISFIAPTVFNLMMPKNKRLGIQTVATAICLLLSASLIGSQINHRVSFARLANSVSSSSEPQFVKWNHLSGSPDQIAAISWIRSNTNGDEIIATNRRCQQISFCGTPKWKLLSAISHRQILLEGNSTGLPNETPWVDERKILSEEFIVAPNQKMANRLYELGVRWHYVELSYIETPLGWEPLELAQQRTWEPWAEVVYRNNTVVVLKIKPPTP